MDFLHIRMMHTSLLVSDRCKCTCWHKYHTFNSQGQCVSSFASSELLLLSPDAKRTCGRLLRQNFHAFTCKSCRIDLCKCIYIYNYTKLYIYYIYILHGYIVSIYSIITLIHVTLHSRSQNRLKNIIEESWVQYRTCFHLYVHAPKSHTMHYATMVISITSMTMPLFRIDHRHLNHTGLTCTYIGLTVVPQICLISQSILQFR